MTERDLNGFLAGESSFLFKVDKYIYVLHLASFSVLYVYVALWSTMMSSKKGFKHILGTCKDPLHPF